MELRFLGNSGLQMSVISLGTMTFGGEGRFGKMGNIQAEEARRMIEISMDAGVNTIDTADIYSSGKSEVVVGAALGSRRKDVILATKVFNRMGPLAHDIGLSRKHIIDGCEASLRRLKTDYIDLYQAHTIDSLVPLEETMRAFDDLIAEGKVRYIGCSNFSGWQLMKSLAISERDGLAPFISQQINYSLLARDAEFELIPLGIDQRVGVMAWSPLHFGWLSGKFRRGQPRPAESRLNDLDAPGTVDPERAYRIVDVLVKIAEARGVSVAQVALNWVLRKPGVDTVIIGARNEAQLRDNLSAANWSLTADEVAQLDQVSAQPEPYPYWHQQKFAGDRNPKLPSVRG